MSKRQSSEIQHSASASNGEAVIYLRISTSESQKGILSLPAQSELLRKYGHSSALRIVAEFVDIENAKTRGRSSFTQMVTFLQKNPSVKHILVEKTDRLNRNFKDYVLISDLGCALHIVKDGKVTHVDSNSPETLQHRIKIVLAKIFIDDLGKAVRKGMTEKAEHGHWPSYAPLGYLNAKLPSGKNIIVQDEDRAKLIHRLFEKYATGNHTLKQLAKWSASAGLTSRRSGNPINTVTIESILRNLIYTGDFEFRGKQYKGIHEGIISLKIWYQVQSVLNRRCSFRVTKRNPDAKHVVAKSLDRSTLK
jgi:DNA invertase Pin-like site-specific DNA recombinase